MKVLVDLEEQNIVNTISEIIENLAPFDNLEKEHIQDTLEWIQSGNPIFRIRKPDIPPKHLVSYFVLFDKDSRKILLVDHKKAQLWLPPGGHVEVNEHPKDTAIRECQEELGIKAEFWKDLPIFLTSTVTVGLTAGHTDVSLWYIIKGSHKQTYEFDKEEFNSIRWFSLDEVPFEHSEPHMKRFIDKLKRMFQS